MQRALMAGIFLAAMLALLGVFVILRRMAFFSDGIAHASLAGVAVGLIFSLNPLLTAVLLSAVFALIIYILEDKYQLASDTAIGILFTSGMALGVLLISLQPGYQPELISFLFGNILAIVSSELWIILGVGLAVFALAAGYLKQIALWSLNPEMAYLSGVRVKLLQPLLYVLLAVATVLGIKVLGVVLVSALLIIPVATAKLFSSSFRRLVIWSVIVSEISVLGGLFVSYSLNWPTGPAIVLTSALLFIVAGIFSSLRR